MHLVPCASDYRADTDRPPQSCIGSFVSYYLVKILPFWGLSLLFTCVAFLAPLVYVSNKETVDEQLRRANEVISKQTEQVRTVAAQQAERALQTTKTYTNEYTSRARSTAQQYMGKAKESEMAQKAGVAGYAANAEAQLKGDSTSSEYAQGSPARERAQEKSASEHVPSYQTSTASYSNSDFPQAPRQDPTSPSVAETAKKLGEEPMRGE